MKRITLFVLALMLGVGTLGAQELWESISWKNLRAHPAPIPVIGEVAPVHSDLNTPSLWSIGVETLDRNFAEFSKFKQYIGETGVGYGRLQSGWARTEKKKGKYDFSWLDEHVDGLLAEGVHPWMCLCYGNPIYSEHGITLNSQIFPEGHIMDAWLRYVRAIVQHYKGKVTMWEVWNEPDGNRTSYELYAHLFARTAKVIREVDPEAKIAAFACVFPNLAYIGKALKIIEEEDAIQYIDYLTSHAYYQIPETVVPSLKQLRKLVDKYNPGIKLLQGEAGCPSRLEYGHSALKDVDWTETSQAKWDLRQMLNYYSLGIPYSVFTMVDLQYEWKLQTFGLLRMDLQKNPAYKRPKFYAVQHVTSLITPDIVPLETVSAIGTQAQDLRCVGLGKEGKPVGCILWFSGLTPTSSLDRTLVENLVLKGLILKDPVYVDLVTGYVHDLKDIVVPKGAGDPAGITFSGLPLWDAPVLIIERGEVPMKQD